jgi:hypothetical protein
MLLGAITSILNIISPASIIFISSSLTSKARFCSMLSTKALVGAYRSIRGGAPEATHRLVLFYYLKDVFNILNKV